MVEDASFWQLAAPSVLQEQMNVTIRHHGYFQDKVNLRMIQCQHRSQENYCKSGASKKMRPGHQRTPWPKAKNPSFSSHGKRKLPVFFRRPLHTTTNKASASRIERLQWRMVQLAQWN